MSSVRIALVLSLLTLAAACNGANYSTPQPPTTPTAGDPGSTAASMVAIPNGAATLGSQAFPPNPLNVTVGTTVTWANTDTVAHTSTSDAGAWDSAVIAPGKQFAVPFNTAGTFTYHCAIHPGMVGTVVVR